MLLVGFTLFSTTQLIPQFAQNLLQLRRARRPARRSRSAASRAALMMPFAGIAASKLPPKLLVGAGVRRTGFALMHTSHLNGDIGFFDLSMTRVYQSLALPFLFVSLTTAGYVGIPPDSNSEASAIINLTRNLGGSVGVAIGDDRARVAHAVPPRAARRARVALRRRRRGSFARTAWPRRSSSCRRRRRC